MKNWHEVQHERRNRDHCFHQHRPPLADVASAQCPRLEVLDVLGGSYDWFRFRMVGAMKISHIFIILAAIVAAPHLPKEIGYVDAVIFMIFSVWYMGKGE